MAFSQFSRASSVSEIQDSIISHYGLSLQQVIAYRELFYMYDSDGNGYIDAGEVEKILRMRGIDDKEDQVHAVFEELDIDNAASYYNGREILPAIWEKPDEQAISDKQIKQVRDAFLLFDKNGDGIITISEVTAILISLGKDPKQASVAGLMKPFDADGSGTIEFNEFLAVMAKLLQEEDSEDELIEIFRIMDQDGDGFISKSDLREVVIRIGSNLTNQDLDEMVEEADKDGDGQITYEEFLKIMEARS